MSMKSYLFSVSDSGLGPSYGFKTGVTFGGLGDSPGILLAKTLGSAPAVVPTPNLPTVTELGQGQYQLLYDPETAGDAVFVLDAGSQVTLAGTLTPVNQTVTVTGTNTTFTSQAVVGRYLVFANDPTATAYRVQAVASNTSLTISSRYEAGDNTVTAGPANLMTLPNFFDRYIQFDTRRLDSRADLAFGVTGGVALTPSGLDAVPVETGVNARQALSPILATAAGRIAGQESNAPVILAGNDPATVRISATTDNNGNRTAVTLSLPS